MSRHDVVIVDFRKYPDTQHWRFAMYRLGEDEHGTWLWAPEGSRAQRGNEPAVSTRSRNIKLITDGAWWSAIWSSTVTQHRSEELYVDIATPAEWIGDTVRMIDLDLDIGRWNDGTVEVLDEDEFAEHTASLGYPDHLVDRARATTAKTYLDVVNRVEPFGEVGGDWMRQAGELDRPAL